MPRALQDRYLGPLSRDIIPDYVNYARVCFSAFGDRVKHWITFNEPDVICGHGYSTGVFAPGRSSDRTRCPEGDSSTEPWIVAHHLLLCHGYAVQLYRREFQAVHGGKIGITLNGDWCEPFSPKDKDGYPPSRSPLLTAGFPTFTSLIPLGWTFVRLFSPRMLIIAAQRRLEFWIGHYA